MAGANIDANDVPPLRINLQPNWAASMIAKGLSFPDEPIFYQVVHNDRHACPRQTQFA